MALPLNAVIEAAYVGRCNLQTIMSVFHYRVANISTIQGTNEELEEFRQRFGTLGVGSQLVNYLNVMPSNYTLTLVTAQAIIPFRSRKNVQSNSIGGTNANAASTSNLQASITLTTALGGRDQVGGKRLLLPDGTYEDGLVNDQQQQLMYALGGNFVAPITAIQGGGVYNPCIWHRAFPLNPPSDVVGFITQRTVRVIRRRTVGVGV